jgi:hypothetical protein
LYVFFFSFFVFCIHLDDDDVDSIPPTYTYITTPCTCRLGPANSCL